MSQAVYAHDLVPRGNPLPRSQAGSAELFRLLELLCGFHLVTTSSKYYYQFTNRRVGLTTPNSALPACHNILKVLIPIYEPQSRANYAQLCATRSFRN